jgi:hypothetical protein
MNSRTIGKMFIVGALITALVTIFFSGPVRAVDDDPQILYEQCMMLAGHHTLTIGTHECVCSADWRSVCLENGNDWDDGACICTPAVQYCNEIKRARCYNGYGDFIESSCACEHGGQGICYSSSYESCRDTTGTWDPSNCTCSYWYGDPAVCFADQIIKDDCLAIPGATWDSVHCKCYSPSSH